MDLKIQFPDAVAAELLEIPDVDAFVSRTVAAALRKRPAAETTTMSGESRWAKLVRRVENEPEQLGEHYPRFKDDIRIFRDEFRFKHDDQE